MLNRMRAIKGPLKSLLGRLPFSLQRSLSRTRLFLPYYHLVSEARTPHFSSFCEHYPSPRKFRTDLDFFLKHFRAITLPELIAHRRHGAALPENPFLLSFDDGYREVYEIAAPILLEKGVPATIFVNTSSLDNKKLIFYNQLGLLNGRLLSSGRPAKAVSEIIWSIDFFQAEKLDRLCEEEGIDAGAYLREQKPYLTSEQVSDLIKKGFTIGSHSMDHPPYAKLGVDEQVRQTLESLRELKERFNVRYAAFAFPGSDDGVPMEFFRRIADHVDVSFGTTAGAYDDIPGHFQRTSFEYSPEPAERVLAERYGVEFLKRIAGRAVKERPR
jgi:peptidoglycan/xylan/chitin deacetylase (PgdA/CDA1 family)